SYANSSSDEYHQSQRASRGEGHITQTTIEQQWESQLINDAEFTANTQLPSVTFDVNNAQLGQRVGEEVSHFYHPTPPPPRNPTGFWRGVDNLLKMREGTIEAFSSVVSNHYQMPNDRWEAIGYAVGVPLAMGAEFIASEGVLGLEAIENIYQGSQQLFAGVSQKLERWGLFGGNGVESVVNLGDKTVRFIQIASGATKTEVRELLSSGDIGINPQQLEKIKDLLGNGRMDRINIKITQSGDIRFSAERAGRTNGYQRMSFEIGVDGSTNKVVQTAFDDANTLVRQRPGEFKNNLYDVKKWNRQTY
ncbi:MAG: hypothetical protein WAW84_07795, partial [Candidatus Rickettsiella isopodorum]